jgi:hypothetical protein
VASAPIQLGVDVVDSFAGNARAQSRMDDLFAAVQREAWANQDAMKFGPAGPLARFVHQFGTGIGEHVGEVVSADERGDYVGVGQGATKVVGDISVAAGGVVAARQLATLPGRFAAGPGASSGMLNRNPPNTIGEGASRSHGVVSGELANGEVGVKAPPSLDERISARQYRGDKYRDANGRLRHTDGSFAEDGAARARRAVRRSERTGHGNTAGDQIAYLYARYDADGNFLKWGITQDLDRRYTDVELAGGRLVQETNGPRREILRQERELVETCPGPLNCEPWAGKRRAPEKK